MPGAKLSGRHLIQNLWSGYGRLERVNLEYSKCASLILKWINPPKKQQHPRGFDGEIGHHRKMNSYAVESHWYRHHRPLFEYPRMAELLYVERSSQGLIIMLEDLDSAGFSRRIDEASFAQACVCLDWLATLHAETLGLAPDGLWSTGSYWHLKTRPEEWARMQNLALKKGASCIDEKLTQAHYQCFVHGDAKLANFCFSEDGSSVAAVDFQYVGAGVGMRDVVYFLSSAFLGEDLEASADKLLHEYFKYLRKRARISNVDFCKLEEEWRSLYPLAWADFYRFLDGWAPGHWKMHAYSEAMVESALASLNAVVRPHR